MERLETRIDELTAFLDHYRPSGPHPVLWVGPGASIAAGSPSPEQIEAILRKRLPGAGATGAALVEAFIDRFSEADFRAVLQREFGKPRPVTPLHAALARLAGAGVCPWIVTTNQDRLLEDALGDAGIPFVVQSLEDNFSLQAVGEVHLVKLLGDVGDWESAVLASLDGEGFEQSFPLLVRQLDLALRTRPVVFVGCAMDGPRLLAWLRGLSREERRGLFASRAVLTGQEWERLPDEVRDLLGSANVKPILVPDGAAAERLFLEAARELAPLEPGELVFEIDPGEKDWTIVGPTPESAPHIVPNPLLDSGFRFLLAELRASASRPIALDNPRARLLEDDLHALAKRISERLTPVLLSDAAREAVRRRIADVDRGRARLVLRVRDAGIRGDLALALPWELLAPEPGTLAVHAGQLDVVREAVTDGAPELEKAVEPLKVAVTIAAPENQTALRYEEEAFRLYAALSSLGQRIAFADLGGVDDLIQVAAEEAASVIHFTGHGLPGRLAFEDETGLADDVEIADLVRRLRIALVKSGRAASFPRLFFLASCHGASGRRPGSSRMGLSREPVFSREVDEELAPLLAEGPSTAAVLHRSGFVQVIGYFGPVGDALSTRAEEAFYRALARCETTLQAVAEARATLDKALEVEGVRVRYPLGWAQLALYHRGPDLPLAVPGEPAAPPRRRQTMDVSGLPVLRHGFIGRRALLHEIRRKVRDGESLFVFQGLGGLGKTALASHLLTQVFAEDPKDQLVLRCAGLESDSNPIDTLRRQAEDHGPVLEIPGWDAEVRALRDRLPDPAPGLGEVVRRLRSVRPGLVLYVDNMEALQSGPKTGEPRAVGSWRPEAEGFWGEMEGLAESGLVFISTRYAWNGLDPRSWFPIEPMGEADSLRLIDSFAELAALPWKVRSLLAEKVDGHPRTVEYLNALVSERRRSLGLGFRVTDAWDDVVEPILPETTGRITADLLLVELWKRLSEETRQHAGALAALWGPAPWEVIVALGTSATADELVRASLLTLHRNRVAFAEEWRWIERWGYHDLVKDFIANHPEATESQEVHTQAGRAYARFIASNSITWADQMRAVLHLHMADLGDEAWPLTRELVIWLRDQGNYGVALSFIEAAEVSGVTGERLAWTLMSIAQLRRLQGERGDDLWDLLERALALATSDEVKSDVLGERAAFCEARGKLDEAEAALQSAMELQRKIDPEGSGEALLLNELARVHIAQEEFEKTEPLLRRALSILEKLGLSEEADAGTVLSNLGVCLLMQGKGEEAGVMFSKAVDIGEHKLPEDHPAISTSLANLARLRTLDGRAEEGERIAQRALEITRKIGPQTPAVGDVLTILAQAQSAQGKAEARNTAREALEIIEASQGREHPTAQYATLILREIIEEGATVVDRMVALGEELKGKEDPEEEASIRQRVIELLQESPYQDRREITMTIAGLLADQALTFLQIGRLEEARRLLEEAIVSGEEANHPGLEEFKENLENLDALQLYKQSLATSDRGDLEGAIRALERCIPLLRQWNGPRRSSLLIDALCGLGSSYGKVGRHVEAVGVLEELVALGERESSARLDLFREMLAEQRAMLQSSLTAEPLPGGPFPEFAP